MFKEKWIHGKNDYNQMNRISIPFKISALGLLFSIILVVLIFAPIVILGYEFLSIYFYLFLANTFLLIIGIALLIIFFMFVSALTTYYSVKFNKLLLKDNLSLQAINEKDVFFYQLFNPYFIIFLVIIFLIFGGII